MPILSNQGRTVPELPSLSSDNIGNSDLLIIQNIASNSTKRSSVLSFCTKAANVITAFSDLKFTGANNSFTGSINNLVDNYSVITQAIPNIVKRIKVTDYLEIGQNSSVVTNLTAYVNNFVVNQTQKSSTSLQLIGNGSNSSITIQGYPSGLNVINTPVTVETIFANSFVGNLTGDVNGNINSTGNSNFFNVDIGNNLTVAYTIINNADINGGTIDNSVIGNSLPSRITGSKILAKNGFEGNLTGNVTGNLTGTTVTANNIIGLDDIIGNLTGNVNGTVSGNVSGDLTGDVYSSTGNKVLDNGPGAANKSSFYGTASYSRNGLNFSSFSSSYALTASCAKRVVGNVLGNVKGDVEGNVLGDLTGNVLGDVTGDIRSNLNQIVLDNGTGVPNTATFYGTASYARNGKQFSSFSSSYAFTSSFANRAMSSSYALSSLSVAGVVDSALQANQAILAKTASFINQFNNKTYALPYYNGINLENTPEYNQLTFFPNYPYPAWSGGAGGNTGFGFLKLSGSPVQRRNYLNIDTKATNGIGQSHLVLSVNNNLLNRYPFSSPFYQTFSSFGPENWDLFTEKSGSFFLQSNINSLNFTNEIYKSACVGNRADASSLINSFKIIRNNVYFWADRYNVSTPSRDGSIGIGVPLLNDSPATNSPLKARLHINVYSASVANISTGNWTDPATVNHQHGAILVTYGTGSDATYSRKTFVVSSSGNIYAAGNANFAGYTTGSFRGRTGWTLNGKNVSFWGTGSHTVSSSYSLRSSGSLASMTSSYTSLLPFQLFNSVNYGTRDGSSTSNPSTAANYPVPIGDPSGPTRVQPLVIPAGKKLRWFKISGTIKAPTTNNYQIAGVTVNAESSPLPASTTFSSLGWGTSYNLSANSVLPFTIEGSLGGRSLTTLTMNLNIIPAGIPENNLTAYVIVYYDN